jgi:hypothetical protein
MATSQLLSTLVPLVVGALIGFIPTYLLELRRERNALRTRWDEPLLNLSKDFTDSARQLLHLSRRFHRSSDPEQQMDKIDDQHRRLRGLSDQIHLLGSKDVQAAAMLVRHHAYAVRAVLAEGRPDRRAKDYPGTTPESRFQEALLGFYVAVRVQLRVTAPREMSPYEVLPGDPWRPEFQ